MSETRSHELPGASLAGDRESADAAASADHCGSGIAPAPAASASQEIEARAAALIARRTGHDIGAHLAHRLGSGMRLLALGASAGHLAVDIAHRVPGTAAVCIDDNAEWMQGAELRARALTADVQFAALELDGLQLQPAEFDLVFCHAVLHRVRALGALADQIKRALRPGGVLVIVELVARSGYSMWPETRDIAQSLWKTLPRKFRLNHTGYGTPLIDDDIWNPEPLPDGAEVPRPEDVIPVLGERFASEHFVPYFSLSRRFFDSMYGPNYDLALPLDRAVFNWIWELDVYYLATKTLRPETFFGIYRAR